MDDFYIVLASNGAPAMYPNNTCYHFYNPLPQPLHLSGKWRVALQEITYENSINTIVDEQIRIYTRPAAVIGVEKIEEYKSGSSKKPIFFDIEALTVGEIVCNIKINRNMVESKGFEYPLNIKLLPIDENRTDVKVFVSEITKGELRVEMRILKAGYKYELWSTKTRYPPDAIDLVTLKPGYYSTEEKLLEELNRVLGGKGIFELESVGNEKYFTLKTLSNNTRLELMHGLHYVLGYGKTLLDREGFRAKRRADLIRGTFAMFIYCDIVNNVMVGNTEAPLLRTVHLQKTDRGATLNHLFNPGFYMQVAKPYINVIEVDIRSDSGEPFPFAKDCKMLLTLHFKCESEESLTLLPPITHYTSEKFFIQ